MSATFALTRGQMARLQSLIHEALVHVSGGLTDMFGAEVVVRAMHVRTVPLAEVVSIVGSPEMEVAGAYLQSEGELPGHLLLMMPLSTAYNLCDVLLEQPAGTTTELGEMEASALGEVGNIVGSFFLNSIADRSGLRMQVTPPGVVNDMAGAVIDIALLDVAMYADEAVVIDATFEHGGRHWPAWFMAFPDPIHLAGLVAEGGDA